MTDPFPLSKSILIVRSGFTERQNRQNKESELAGTS